MPSTTSFPGAVPELFGTEVDLRELCEADIPAWFSRATDAESADLAGDDIPVSIEAGADWLPRHRERFRRRAGIRWAIELKGASDSVGTIGLAITSKAERTAELGVVVACGNWGKGVAASATQLVVRYAFGSLGLGAIQAEVLRRLHKVDDLCRRLHALR